MSARMSTVIVVCIVAILGGALLAVLYTALIDGDKVFGAVTGAAIAAPIVLFEMFVMRGHLGAPLRHLPLWGIALVSFGAIRQIASGA